MTSLHMMTCRDGVPKVIKHVLLVKKIHPRFRLDLALDEFNPFGNMSTTYSMWPVVLVLYNLLPWKCMKESNFFMSLLILGPKSPGKEIDIYLKPLIDELKEL